MIELPGFAIEIWFCAVGLGIALYEFQGRGFR